MITFNQLGKYGRLGNQMFQIASTIGIATKHGFEFGFPEWINHDHLERFGSTEDCSIQKYFKNKLPEAGKTIREQFVPWGFHHDLQVNDLTNITGHLQSEKYFEHCQDLVRHYFEFANEVEPLPEGAIVIHVRRGDYDDNYHPTLKYDYYIKALQELNKHFRFTKEQPTFVFSDSTEEVKQMFSDGFTIVEGNHYIKDLQIMATGTHHIISNSTFSWWAWWLSGKRGKVIAPANWFGKIAGISAKDIYTNEMIVI